MKKFNRNILILIGFFAFLIIGPVGEIYGRETVFNSSKKASAGKIIVSVTEARVRSAPNLNAGVVGAAKLGSVYEMLARKGDWYKISFNSKGDVWISGTIVESFDYARRGQIYQRLADKYFKRGEMDYDTASEVFEFLNRIEPEVADMSVTADLAYKKLLALAAALEKIPFDKTDQDPYKRFTEVYSPQVVYSEPAGQYAVRAELWWDLRKTFSKNPLADEMAWQGANTLIPGECEGWVVCHLSVLRQTSGQYLEFYPNGKHTAKALQDVTESLEYIADGADGKETTGYYITPDPDDRVQLEKSVSELRTIVGPIEGTAKTKIIGYLDKIEAGYRPKQDKSDADVADETGLDEFWTKFRAAVVKKDKTTVADMTRFPLSMPFGQKEIKTRAEFLKNYDRIMNMETDSAKCFEREDLTREDGRFGIYCGFKNALDDENNKPVYFYFEKTASGWKMVGVDNINE
ncbi:MAG: SH3 domain-containing protein [Pyrinomonadaceae bacterium]